MVSVFVGMNSTEHIHPCRDKFNSHDTEQLETRSSLREQRREIVAFLRTRELISEQNLKKV